MNDLEYKISKSSNRKYCVLVGNCTTAIYVALLSKGFMGKRIVVPANVCMNVVLPIYFSNNTPVFIDIEKDTLGLDINKMPRSDVDAVVAVHSYGNVCKIKEIDEYCKRNNLFLIEDAAVAQGLFFEGRPIGSFGDISVLSFGSGKNINIGHGGAILTDDKELYLKICNIVYSLEVFSLSAKRVQDSISFKHTQIYNIDFGKSLNYYYYYFKKLFLENQKSFLYQFNNKFQKILDDKLDKLEHLIAVRQKNSAYLKDKFSGYNGIFILDCLNSSSFWRFNIFVENYRDELFKLLLEKKYKVSSWHHSVYLMFEDRSDIYTPVSDWIGNNILNIWVNEDIDINYLNSISYDIINFLKVKCG